jgi:hypothetical protein
MAASHGPRSFVRRLAYAGLASSTLTVFAAERFTTPPNAFTAGFAVGCQNAISPNRVRTLTVLPEETVTFEVVDRKAKSGYTALPTDGRLVPQNTGRWMWTSPPKPGLYPIHVVAAGGGDEVTLQAFVVVPFNRLTGDLLNGYQIGRYPEKPLRGLADYKQPTGFVEVTPENKDTQVSPHFRLGQFLCKQPADSQKYVILNERLLLALEYALEQVNEAGYHVNTFHIMSGYRTPAYNRSLGNVRYSMHQWGAAADIFIDTNEDGVMDDLNNDGRSDIHDAEVLYNLIDVAAARPEANGLIGGLGKYAPTAAHGPFVHIDVRDRTARW